MEKLLKFLLIFLVSFGLAIAGYAYNSPVLYDLKVTECTAPAPTDFRMTTRGPDFIDVAWEPAWVNATQTIAVFTGAENAGTTTWDALYTLSNIVGTTFRLPNLPTGELYRIQISTNCSLNDSGTDTEHIDEKTGLDLIVPGRIPINPAVIPCENIPYELFSNKWLGFKVKYVNGEITYSSLFEFRIKTYKDFNDIFQTRVVIARVGVQNTIVATNDLDMFPTLNHPLLEAPDPFMLQRLSTTINDKIGRILIQRGTSLVNPHVDICIADSPPPYWNYNNYSLEVLMADNSIGMLQEPNSNVDILLGDRPIDKPQFKITNTLCSSILKIKTDDRVMDLEKLKICIVSSTGEYLTAEYFFNTYNELHVPVNQLNSGLYVLSIQNSRSSDSFKFIKVD